MFTRSEKESLRSAQDTKHLWSVPSTSTSKVAYHWLPPAGIISDEEISDISPILARSKKEVRDDKNRDDVGKSKKPTMCGLCSQEKPHRTLAFFDDSSCDYGRSGNVKLEKRRVPPSSSQKGKPPVSNKEIKKPSQRTVATWCRGDDDMEPSAKMLALIKQLRIAENAGDKTIVFSQCSYSLPPFLVFVCVGANDDSHTEQGRRC